MKWLRQVLVSLSVALMVVCCGAILLFNWSALGWKALTVSTGSMRPTIPPGSLVLMHSVPNTSLKVGDVITYANPQKINTTITHRIVETYKLDGKVPAFITKGDANPTPDRPIVGGLVKGKAVWHVPYIGGWLNWTKTWAGIAVLVYLPALIVMIEEAQKLVVYYRKTAPYKTALILAREKSMAKGRPKFATASALSITLLAVSIVFAYPVHALMKSNTVALINNHISVAPITRPNPCNTSGNSTTITVVGTGGGNVNVSNSNNQNAQTGNATSTNGGSATSGNATNCNNTNINITVNGH